MRPSIQHIAERAGVSRMTVSNVLRGRDGSASDETRRRVLEAARDLNYVPVAQPASQRRHIETRTLSVVFDDIAMGPSGFGSDTFGGMTKAATRLDYDLLTLLRSQPHGELDREEMRFLDRRSDGVIFVSDRIPSRKALIETLVQHRIPVVVCYGEGVPPGVGSVGVDNVLAMYQAVDCLVQEGHRHIAFLAGPERYGTFGRRCQGFEQAMRERDLPLQENSIIASDQVQMDDEAGAATVRQVMASQATALVCANDLLAVTFWNAATVQGVRVPQDLSLIGMDNLPMSVQRGLCSIELPAAQIGTVAIEVMARRLQQGRLQQGGESSDEHIVLPTLLIERDSICAPLGRQAVSSKQRRERSTKKF